MFLLLKTHPKYVHLKSPRQVRSDSYVMFDSWPQLLRRYRPGPLSWTRFYLPRFRSCPPVCPSIMATITRSVRSISFFYQPPTSLLPMLVTVHRDRYTPCWPYSPFKQRSSNLRLRSSLFRSSRISRTSLYAQSGRTWMQSCVWKKYL